MNQISIVIFMFFVGSLIALQGSVNSALGKFLEHPLHAAIFSFGLGLVALLIASLCLKTGLPTTAKIFSAPKVILIGGLLGAVFVTSVILCVPKVGVANVVMAALCGQIVLSLILDHFGVFGAAARPIDLKRLAGALFVIIGVILVSLPRTR
ncbi:DMT family transporter [Lentisphaera profundi]|uniref:DMT family transporter n=1 Tax=Lentisphaera profundi TaxID=1658616 RepID=A0ABY7W312_9BACT|nr:DMT family transporter [Lentisphaera profundi]WDE98668.1 DMT family transporter [Lentisphaera profundi]